MGSSGLRIRCAVSWFSFQLARHLPVTLSYGQIDATLLEHSVHRLARPPLALQLLNPRSDLTPDCGALDVALASENRSPRGRIESGIVAVPINDQFGSPVNVDGVSHESFRVDL